MLLKIERGNGVVALLCLHFDGPQIVAFDFCIFGKHDHTLRELSLDLLEFGFAFDGLAFLGVGQDDGLEFREQRL